MYLYDIPRVDRGWLGSESEEVDDYSCLARFHYLRTIKLLQAVRDDVGREEFELVWNSFDSLKNSGYALEAINNTDTRLLFRRSGVSV